MNANPFYNVIYSNILVIFTYFFHCSAPDMIMVICVNGSLEKGCSRHAVDVDPADL